MMWENEVEIDGFEILMLKHFQWNIILSWKTAAHKKKKIYTQIERSLGFDRKSMLHFKLTYKMF